MRHVLQALSLACLLQIPAVAEPPPPDTSPITDFTIDLVPRLQKNNLVTSPYLVSSAFALLDAAASGSTKQQIDSVFHFPKDYEFPMLDNDGTPDAKQPKSTKSATLEFSSTLYVDQRVSLSPDFQAASAKSFKSHMSSVDFRNPRATADAINRAVALKTHARIQDIIDPKLLARFNSLDNSLAMILTNTLYFKGKWKTAFEPNGTKAANFFVPHEPVFPISMMSLHNGWFDYGQFDGLRVLRVPYDDDRFSMLIVLPNNAGGFARPDKRPDAAACRKMLAKLNPTLVDLYLPRFAITDTHDLGRPLFAMGVRDAFTEKADFFKLTTDIKPIYLCFAFEQATFAVDETGAEAASAVAVGEGIFSSDEPSAPPRPIIFRVDHPCFLILLHNPTQTPLFVVGLSHPTAR
jgi:serpin B